MPILHLLARILLFSIDAFWLYLSVRFMFFWRWDVTNRMFENMDYFKLIFPQYLELALLLASMVLLLQSSAKIDHPILIAVILNALAFVIFVFVSGKI